MAEAWCATCCPPAFRPALFAMPTCNGAMKFSAVYSDSSLRIRSCRSSVAVQSSRRYSDPRGCCSSASTPESDDSDSCSVESHLTSRRQLLLLVSGAAVTAAALPSYADEVSSLLAVVLYHSCFCASGLMRALFKSYISPILLRLLSVVNLVLAGDKSALFIWSSQVET